jgi:hypothetical protein
MQCYEDYDTFRKSRANIWISLGKVAENMRVCLTSGPGMLSFTKILRSVQQSDKIKSSQVHFPTLKIKNKIKIHFFSCTLKSFLLRVLHLTSVHYFRFTIQANLIYFLILFLLRGLNAPPFLETSAIYKYILNTKRQISTYKN